MSKIYVSISGGCLTAILSDDPTIEVEIWDWDNIKEEENSTDIKAMEEEWSALAGILFDIS